LSEKISHEVQALPEAIQREVLDFVEFLNARRRPGEDEAWTAFGRRYPAASGNLRRLLTIPSPISERPP